MDSDPRHDDDEPGTGGDEPGTGGDDNAETPPPLPAEDDDSALGDTDQHSDADA